METKVNITQIRSIIKRSKKQKRTIQALGLGKINKSKTLKITPATQGMIDKVKHLIKIQSI